MRNDYCPCNIVGQATYQKFESKTFKRLDYCTLGFSDLIGGEIDQRETDWTGLDYYTGRWTILEVQKGFALLQTTFTNLLYVENTFTVELFMRWKLEIRDCNNFILTVTPMSVFERIFFSLLSVTLNTRSIHCYKE